MLVLCRLSNFTHDYIFFMYEPITTDRSIGISRDNEPPRSKTARYQMNLFSFLSLVMGED